MDRYFSLKRPAESSDGQPAAKRQKESETSSELDEFNARVASINATYEDTEKTVLVETLTRAATLSIFPFPPSPAHLRLTVEVLLELLAHVFADKSAVEISLSQHTLLNAIVRWTMLECGWALQSSAADLLVAYAHVARTPGPFEILIAENHIIKQLNARRYTSSSLSLSSCEQHTLNVKKIVYAVNCGHGEKVWICAHRAWKPSSRDTIFPPLIKRLLYV